MARSMLPDLKNYKLDTVVEAVGGNLENHHRAVEDAESTADIFVKFVARLKQMGVTDLDTLNEMSQMSNNGKRIILLFLLSTILAVLIYIDLFPGHIWIITREDHVFQRAFLQNTEKV